MTIKCTELWPRGNKIDFLLRNLLSALNYVLASPLTLSISLVENDTLQIYCFQSVFTKCSFQERVSEFTLRKLEPKQCSYD